MEEGRGESDGPLVRPDEKEYRKAQEIVIPIQSDDIERIVMSQCANCESVAGGLGSELTQLSNIFTFLTDVKAIVLATQLRLSSEKVDFAKGIRELRAIPPVNSMDPLSIKSYVERYQNTWNQYLKGVLTKVDMSTFHNVFSCNRSRISGILRSVVHPAIEDGDSGRSVCECFDKVSQMRRRVATNFSILLHGKRIQDANELRNELISTWDEIVNFVNMSGQMTPDLMYTMTDCSKVMLDAVLDLKTLLILKRMVPIVDRACNKILKGGECEIPQDWLKEENELMVSVEPTTSFLRMFMEFKETMKSNQPATEIYENLKVFIEKIRDVTCFGLGPVLCSLYFKFRQLELANIKLKWGCEHMKPGEAGTELYLSVVEVIAAFKTVIGREIETDMIRELLIPLIQVVRERAGSQSLSGHKMAGFARIDLLTALLDEIVASLRIIDDTLCVAYQVDQIIARKLGDFPLEPLNFREKFFQFPALLSHYDHSVPKVTHDVNQEYHDFVGRLSTILRAKGLNMSVSGEQQEIEIPDIRGLLEVFRDFHDRDLVQAILYGPPVMTEEETFRVLSQIYHENMGNSEPNEQVEWAAEALHMLHFIFLSMEGIGLLSYSNAWHLTYMRAQVAFMAKKDLLAGASILTYVPDEQSAEVKEAWKDCIASAGVLDSISVLDEIRLNFETVLKVIVEKPDVQGARDILAWFLQNLSQVPYHEDIARVLEIMQGFEDPRLATVPTLFHSYSDKLKTDRASSTSIEFVAAFLGTADPLKLIDTCMASHVRVLIHFLTVCSELGLISFDATVKDELAAAPVGGLSTPLTKLHESLVVHCDTLFKTIAADLVKICPKSLAAWFDLISRGGFCEDNLVSLFEEALGVRPEEKEHVFMMISKLCYLLGFVRVRDAICRGFDELNFSMLRQINMRFVDGFANAFLFLTNALSISCIVSKKITASCRMLMQFVDQIPITKKMNANIMNQISTCSGQIRTGADFFCFKRQLSLIESAVKATGSTDFIASFEGEIKPALEALKPTPEQLTLLKTMLKKECDNAETITLVSDCVNTILILCRLVADADAFSNFCNSNTATFVSLAPPVSAMLPEDAQPPENPEIVIPMQYVLSRNNRPLAQFQRLVCEDMCRKPEKSEDTVLLDSLQKAQSQYENRFNPVTTERTALLKEISQLQQEIQKYECEASSKLAIEELSSKLSTTYDSFVSEFSRNDGDIRQLIHLHGTKDLEYHYRILLLDAELAQKEMYLERLRSENEILRARTNTKTLSGAAKLEHASEPEDTPEPQHVSQPHMVSRSDVSSHHQAAPAPFTVERHLHLHDMERYVPKSLEHIFKAHTFLPGEAREQIERLAAKYERMEAPPGQAPQLTSPSDEEVTTTCVEISETKKQYMKERLSDDERRIRNAESIIADLLARCKGQSLP